MESDKPINKPYILKRDPIVHDLPELTRYQFTEPPPYAHQLQGYHLVREQPYFAIFDEMGTGKTRMMIDAMNSLWLDRMIDQVLVVCPNTVKSTWADPDDGQIVQFTPYNFNPDIHMWQSQSSGHYLKKWKLSQGRLRWLVVNYESMRMAAKGMHQIQQYVTKGRTAMILDESTRIKSFRAHQSQGCRTVGASCVRRYIMTGSPVVKSPLDLFSMYNFMNSEILGYKYWTTFRARYAIMGGHCVRGKPVQVIGYQNMAELKAKVEPWYRRVTKDECLDLPDKVYTRRNIPMSKEQDQAYQDMKNKLLVECDGQKFKAPIVLTKLLRLSMISSGFLSQVDENEDTHLIEYDSPKTAAVVEIAKDTDKSIIVFCVFRHEITRLVESLKEENIEAGQIHGGIDNYTRGVFIKNFQAKQTRVIICQVATGGIGITLTAAEIVIYVNNSYSLEHRLQSEDRAHRSGQKEKVTYIDLLSVTHGKAPRQTIDHMALKAIREKKDLADMMLSPVDLQEL